MPRISVIVLSWNGRAHLERCLESLQAQTCPDFEIVVVDNGSTDGSPELVAQRFPAVRLIRHATNLGFAAGSNAGIRATQSEFVATLNNDAWAEPAWLAELLQAMERHPRVGACASKMLLVSRPGTLDSAGIIADRAGITWNRCSGEVAAGPTCRAPRCGGAESDAPTEVFGACAGAALYRRAMLEDVGLFCEDFFCYLEDADLAWRARLRGWRCLYVPTAIVHHAHSATGREGSAFKNRLLGRNKVWLIARNYPSPQVWLYLPIIAAYDAAAVAYHLLARRDVSPLQGRVAGLRGLPRALRQRRDIQARRTVSWAELAMHLSPLRNPLQVLRAQRRLGRFRPVSTVPPVRGAAGPRAKQTR
jgi:GT2 family glycosyltransferase